MAEALYSLEQAKAELRLVYPMYDFEEIDNSLVVTVFGQFKIMVEVGDNQFITSLVVDEFDHVEDYQFNPQPISVFYCDSAPMGVNQVVYKFERYFKGIRANLEKFDRITKKRKFKTEEPPLINHEQRERIKALESEGIEFGGTTYAEAVEFIQEAEYE